MDSIVYTYIELNEFTRLSVAGINHFSMAITDPVQLIIGTNGSGKSSILEELSVLPADKDCYGDNGSKILHVKKGKELWVFKSTFKPKPIHSISRNGVELHSGNATLYKDIVKQHFGITPEIHSLMMGYELFTQMGPNRRKEWMLKLSDDDYDYAIKAYNTLLRDLRDTQGAIKVAKRQLITETGLLIAKEEEDRLASESQSLHDCLTHLLEIRKPVEKQLSKLESDQARLLSEINVGASQLKQLNSLTSSLMPEDDLAEYISDINDQIVSKRAVIDQQTPLILEINRKIEVLQATKEQSSVSIKSDIKTLEEGIDAIKNASSYPSLKTSATVALESFYAVKPALSDVFLTIPNNEDKKYSSVKLQEAKDKLGQQEQIKNTTIERINKHAINLAHMKEHEEKPDTVCPNCNHKFSPHFSLLVFGEVNEAKTNLEAKLETIKADIKELNDYITACTDYSSIYRRYMQTVQQFPSLAGYWQVFLQKKVVTDNPKLGLALLDKVEHDIKEQITLQNLQVQLKEKEELLASLSDVGDENLNTLLQQHKDLSDLLEDLTQGVQDALAKKELAVKSQKHHSAIKTSVAKLTRTISEATLLNKEKLETIRREELNLAIRDIQSMLAQRENILNSQSHQKTIVESIRKTLASLEVDEAALQTLVKVLSPSEGLIAEGLLRFINNLVSQMNAVIDKVWTYPMVIQSCSFAEGEAIELNYLFPVQIYKHPKPSPDVRKVSTGQEEMINLAFRLVAMKKLGFQDAPLIIDEFGKTFDEAHRNAATQIFGTLIEQSTFSQLFIVSHYAESYGALANAQICVLSDMNITVPYGGVVPNQHVTIS